ncbi:hypothetical protein [Cetobacterium somerae]
MEKIFREEERKELLKKIEKMSPQKYQEMLTAGKETIESYLENELKKRVIEKISSKEERELLLKLMYIISVVSDEDIDDVEESEEFIKIANLFIDIYTYKQDFILDEIEQIFKKNIKKTILNYENDLEKYMIENLAEKKKKKYEKISEIQIKKKILENEYKKDNEIQEYIKKLKSFENWLNNFNIKSFNSKILERNEYGLLSLAYVVYNPQKLMFDEFIKNKNIKYRWYFEKFSTIFEYKKFMENPNNVEIWKEYYLKALDNIVEKLKSPLEAIQSRKKIILELIKNIKSQNNISVMIVSFTIIEGLLWEIAYEINKKEKIFINQKEVICCDSKNSFKTTKIREILERTKVKEYLDEGFLKYFCEELYDERNPILHGKRICTDCDKIEVCIVKKIFTIDFLLERLIEINGENNGYFLEKKIYKFIKKDQIDLILNNKVDEIIKSNKKEKS